MNGTAAVPGTKTRSYEYSPSGLDMDAAMSLSGLDYMLALASGQLGAAPSISATVGMSGPFDLAHGQAAVEAEAADFLLNPMGLSTGISRRRCWIRSWALQFIRRRRPAPATRLPS